MSKGVEKKKKKKLPRILFGDDNNVEFASTFFDQCGEGREGGIQISNRRILIAEKLAQNLSPIHHVVLCRSRAIYSPQLSSTQARQTCKKPPSSSSSSTWQKNPLLHPTHTTPPRSLRFLADHSSDATSWPPPKPPLIPLLIAGILAFVVDLTGPRRAEVADVHRKVDDAFRTFFSFASCCCCCSC